MLLPWVAPKFSPVIVILAYKAVGLGEMPVICGGAVKFTPSLGAPPTVTTRGPDVAASGTEVTLDVFVHQVPVALLPLNFTLLSPLRPPQPQPLTITISPVLP